MYIRKKNKHFETSSFSIYNIFKKENAFAQQSASPVLGCVRSFSLRRETNARTPCVVFIVVSIHTVLPFAFFSYFLPSLSLLCPAAFLAAPNLFSIIIIQRPNLSHPYLHTIFLKAEFYHPLGKLVPHSHPIPKLYHFSPLPRNFSLS